MYEGREKGKGKGKGKREWKKGREKGREKGKGKREGKREGKKGREKGKGKWEQLPLPLPQRLVPLAASFGKCRIIVLLQFWRLIQSCCLGQ